MWKSSETLGLSLLATLWSCVNAQPGPIVQQRINQAIQNAGNQNPVDWSSFVNPFIGTDNYGDVCPGASVPFGMVKFTTDNVGYAPAGYITDPTAQIRGLSPLHDSGTGSGYGSYGNFEVMPMICSGGFNSCTPRLDQRLRLRKSNTDDATPGWFSQTLDSDIKLEATATRRAGLERFTFPANAKPYFTLDLTNDLPNSFGAGKMHIDPAKGRITLGGKWRSSFGPWDDPKEYYQAFACYDLLNGGKQVLDEYGLWYGAEKGQNTLTLNGTDFDFTSAPAFQAGALFSYQPSSDPIILRVGISFVSSDQACANAESEVGSKTFDEVVDETKGLWNDKLSRVELSVPQTNASVVQMLYSSLYRSFLTPNNATGETQGLFAGTTSPYFDSLYCSWDTFRTFYPLLSLHSPQDFAQIVETYVDGWRKTGFIPECRSNNLPGWTQGGSDATNILAEFAVKYHNEAAQMNVDIEEVFTALKSDGETPSEHWSVMGRQITEYRKYGYVPANLPAKDGDGWATREGSRTLEYTYNDFGIRQVAQVLGKADDLVTYTNYSYNYRNVWDPTVVSDGFHGFMQKRGPDGKFVNLDPTWCSPQDPKANTGERWCSLGDANMNGFYESSSWEYSFFVPHDTAYLVQLMGGNDTYVKRLDHFFDGGYYLAGNEPSFQTPVGYHYVNQPSKSVDRVRQVVYENFGTSPAGLPGNDDQAAMATLLAFDLLGLYPVPSTTQYLIVSPFVPSYKIHTVLPSGTVTTSFTVQNFDPRSLNNPIPAGTTAYVKSVTINGAPAKSNCFFDFYDVFKVGGEVVIELTADKTLGCAGPLPDSLSTGGWAGVR